MYINLSTLSIFLGYVALIGNCHFVLQIPTSIGYDDAHEGAAPCGNFDPTSRVGGPTNWPVGGSAISVLTTHTSVTWDIKAALVNDTSNWVRLVPVLTQTGVGFFCEPHIPGLAAWIGLPAVLQVTQHASDGALYQVGY